MTDVQPSVREVGNFLRQVFCILFIFKIEFLNLLLIETKYEINLLIFLLWKINLILTVQR